MFINLTNHPSSLWGEDQLAAAEQFGEVVDIPFPDISPEAAEEEVNSMAEDYVKEILSHGNGEDITVHVMGEMTFVYALVMRLKALGITCVASTTERIVKEDDGKKISEFKFVQFREY